MEVLQAFHSYNERLHLTREDENDNIIAIIEVVHDIIKA